ncbi:TPA: exo-alpha-sialidase [Streptococcus suis]|uniref:exo-alpha-sialidase n=3 Tax=Streptococcus suis TaxID=1307 RepID=A0A116K647_STRSU|nr:exo-alpha-sialidase [Streptococcus suis]MCK4041537.1 sialidase [Streptococcus suis]NQI12480.1 sialidase [Streptococcus suis]NQS07372.1 sialidase [Streptococcus suis]TII06631.1 sialidase [Streptococcus suis]CYU19816.1 neuraminidase B [Streptococcus suis]
MSNNKLLKSFGVGLLAVTMLSTIQPLIIYAEEPIGTEVVSANEYHSEGYTLENTRIDITNEALDKINSESQTIVLKFQSDKPNSLQSIFGLSNSQSGFRNNYFSIFMRDTGEIGIEVRDKNKGINHLFSRAASIWGTHKGQPVENTIVFTSDSETKTYTLFVNGTKIFSETVENFLPITSIEGIDNVSIGGINREGKDAYTMRGQVNQLSIYNRILSSEEINSKFGKLPYQFIFKSGDTTNANYFRIPALYTLSNGRVLASIDARYGGTHDSRSKINIATSYSDDNGNSWSNPSLPLKFDDYEEQIVEWPRTGNLKNVQINGSASFIDSAIVEDKTTGNVVMIADAMPAGIGNNNADRNDSGFKEIDGKYYLKLKKEDETAFNYSVRDDGVIYDDTTNSPTVYRLNDKYEVFEGDIPLSVEQYSVAFDSSGLQEFHNGKTVPMNVFYRDSLFKVARTNYLGVTISRDKGETWSSFKLLPPMLGLNHNATYLSPGQGLSLSNSNRIIFATYTRGELTYLISDDGGLSWKKSSAPVPFQNATAEAQMVELREGVIRTFFRTTTGKIAYMTSYDSGETWTDVFYLDHISQTNYGTQVTAIKYSKKIEGKDAIILSTPNTKSGRRGGQLWVGLVNPEDDSVEWKYSYNVDNPTFGYSYSALTELPNGHIGLLFEKYDSWSRNELHLSNVVQYIDLEISDIVK